MSQYFHYSEFKWSSKKEIGRFDVESIGENSSIGYILEVDLNYPNLHELHNDYPLAPEKLKISQNMLSKYCSSIANKYEIKIAGVNKLVLNLGNRSKYVVHYINLQLYLSLGMNLTRVHRILKFKQPDSLKKYIDFNTNKKKNEANSFQKDFFKLMNNSTFGKTMENLRKRVSVKSANDPNVRYISKPNFVSQKIFSRTFVAIHEIKPALTLNKPIYVGFSIFFFFFFFFLTTIWLPHGQLRAIIEGTASLTRC